MDASERRCGFARDAVRAVGLENRVEVRHARAEELATSEGFRGRGDLVVARSFGPPSELAECGLPLLTPATGRLVVSVTPETEAVWRAASPEGVTLLFDDVRLTPHGRFLTVHAEDMIADRYPRRPAARRRSPLF